jgi:hypothetical protein
MSQLHFTQRPGLAEGSRIESHFRPSRTTNIILFIGEANTMQACGKPHPMFEFK